MSTVGGNMDKVEINNYEDLYNVLDRINESIDWNTFYEKRVMKAPFLVNNMLPDKMITEFVKEHSIREISSTTAAVTRNSCTVLDRKVRAEEASAAMNRSPVGWPAEASPVRGSIT